MNLTDALTAQVARDPAATAFVEGPDDTSTTFGELWDLSGRAAGELRRRGVRAGDAVLIRVPMSMHLYAVVAALWRIGAVAVFLDPSTSRAQAEYCRSTVDARAEVVGWTARAHRLLTRERRHRGTAPVPVHALFSDSRDPDAAPVADLPLDALALVTFTTGSTGLPKAMGRTHGLLRTQREVVVRHLQLAAGQVDLATQAMFVLANLAEGVTTVVPRADLRRIRALDAGPLVGQAQRCGVTRIGASPTFLERLTVSCETAAVTLPRVTTVFVGAAPVFPSLLDRVRRVVPNADIVTAYGSSEAEPVALCHLRDVSRADRTAMIGGAGLLVGRPVPEATVRIADVAAATDDSATPTTPAFLGAGEPGEIVVSGDHVLPGYLHGSGDDQVKFNADGRRWHRTSDAGYVDAAGRLWLLGRTAARVEDSRGTIYPFQVECAASEIDGVARSALAGREGRRILLVEPSPGARLDPMSVADQIGWARLDAVMVVEHIPVDRRHNAKVDYTALQELVDRIG